MKSSLWLPALCALLAANTVADNRSDSIKPDLHLDLKVDCGASGDGLSNDTDAFQKASQLLQEAGGGTLFIPEGTYLVGRQSHVDGETPYYKSDPIFSVTNINGLKIYGKGAVIRLADGLRYGTFDKATGETFHPKMPFTDRQYRVGDMPIFNIRESQNIEIRDLEIDGNSPNLILGGTWGDKGRQIQATGILLLKSRNVVIHGVYSHHNALDGIAFGFSGLKEGDDPTPCTIEDCRFDYNGRQGFSWVGGIGLKVYRSSFNHTGKAINKGDDAPLSSAPAAGLDIEAEVSVIRDGRFEDCEFIDNTGCGMVADSGDGGYTTFKNCTFQGTTNWSIWPNKPGLKFFDCKIYGSAVHGVGSANPDLATQWTRCEFEDRPWTDGSVYRRGYLLQVNGHLGNLAIRDCNFVAHELRSLWISNGKDEKNPVILEGSTITHRYGGLKEHEFQALFRYTRVTDCRFLEKFAPDDAEAAGKAWSIVAEGVEMDESAPIFVEGPQIKWGTWRDSGRTGILKLK